MKLKLERITKEGDVTTTDTYAISDTNVQTFKTLLTDVSKNIRNSVREHRVFNRGIPVPFSIYHSEIQELLESGYAIVLDNRTQEEKGTSPLLDDDLHGCPE